MYLTVYRLKDKMMGTIVPNINKKGQNDFKKKKNISYESKRQAFKRASDLLFFNSDMQYFVTLTYSNQHKDYSVVLNDLKNFSRREKGLKYIGVVEPHKSGCLHCHLITNKLSTISLRSGKLSAKNWKKGFSDVVHLSTFDENFNVMKYLFKYLKKSKKIGGRWVLKSRNLSKPYVFHRKLDINETFSYLNNLEKNNFNIDKLEIKDYYLRDTIIFKFNN